MCKEHHTKGRLLTLHLYFFFTFQTLWCKLFSQLSFTHTKCLKKHFLNLHPASMLEFENLSTLSFFALPWLYLFLAPTRSAYIDRPKSCGHWRRSLFSWQKSFSLSLLMAVHSAGQIETVAFRNMVNRALPFECALKGRSYSKGGKRLKWTRRCLVMSLLHFTLSLYPRITMF